MAVHLPLKRHISKLDPEFVAQFSLYTLWCNLLKLVILSGLYLNIISECTSWNITSRVFVCSKCWMLNVEYIKDCRSILTQIFHLGLLSQNSTRIFQKKIFVYAFVYWPNQSFHCSLSFSKIMSINYCNILLIQIWTEELKYVLELKKPDIKQIRTK